MVRAGGGEVVEVVDVVGWVGEVVWKMCSSGGGRGVVRGRWGRRCVGEV